MIAGYYVCGSCGHVEPRQLADDGYARPCLDCGQPLDTRTVFDRLVEAELYSERVQARVRCQ